MTNLNSISRTITVKTSITRFIALIIIVFGYSTSGNSLNAKGTPKVEASNNIISKNISNATFSKIEVLGPHSIEYSQSKDNKCKVSVTGPDNIVALLDIKIENGKLKVSYKDEIKINLNGNDLTIFASSPSIDEAKLTGSGDIIFRTNVFCGDLNLLLSGSGDIKTSDIKCSKLNVGLLGSGDISLSSKTSADNASLNLSGSGDINVNELTTKNVQASLNGSGDIEISQVSTGNLHTNLSGSGDIRIEGIKSIEVKASLSGSGDMTLSGNTRNCVLKLQNSGAINAKTLLSENTIANLFGSGSISCHASNSVETTINGSGDIDLYGSPKNVKASGKSPAFLKK